MDVEKDLVCKMIKYIEDREIEYDGEFGHCRKLDELIKDERMPSLYFDLKALLS